MTTAAPTAIRRTSRVRTTLWYVLVDYSSVVYAIVSGLVIAPLTLKFVPVTLYGAWLASGNILAWLGAVDPGFATALSQQIALAFGKADREEAGRLVVAGVVLNGAVALAIAAAGTALVPYLVQMARIPPSVDVSSLLAAAHVVVANTALMTVFFGWLAIAQGLQSTGIGLLFMAGNFLGLGVQVALLYSGFGIMALPLGGLARASVMVVGGAALVLRLIRTEGIPLSRRVSAAMRGLLHSTTFIFSARLLETLAVNMDAFAVSRFVGAERVPMLKFTRTPIDSMHMFVIRPSVALTPALSHLYGTKNMLRVKEVVTRLLRISLWAAAFAGTALAVLNRRFVATWVGAKFFAGDLVNTALCIGFVLQAITATFGNAAFAMGAVKENSVSRAVQSGIAVALVLVGAWLGGIRGVVLAPATAIIVWSVWYLPRVVYRLLAADRADRVQFLAEAGRTTCAAGVTAAVGILLPGTEGWAGLIAAGCAVAATYGLAMAVASRAFRAEMVNLAGVAAARFGVKRPNCPPS